MTMKLLDCVLIGLVCFVIVYILMRELGKKNESESFDAATQKALKMQMKENWGNDTVTKALQMQMKKDNYKNVSEDTLKALSIQRHEDFCAVYEGMECNCGPHTHQLQSDGSKNFLNERNLGAPWYHPVRSGEGFADATGAQPPTDAPNAPLKPDDLLPKDMNHGWTQAYLNCKDLLANKNFVDTERFKFSNEVLDTRNTKYQSLDIRKTPIVSHNPVSIWQKSPVEKSMWEYTRPNLDG